MKHLLLAASAALNAWLLLIVALQGAQPAAVPVVADGRDTVRLDAARLKQPEALHAELIAHGLDEELTKPIILEVVLAATSSVGSQAYWSSTPSDEYDRAVRKLEALAQARALIERIYGSGASRDPAFARLYAPLGKRFAFLSADEQIATQKLRLRFARAAAVGEPGISVSGRPPSRRPSPWRNTHERFMAELTQLLGPEQAFEYELRESPLANELRSAGISLTETQYRRAFKILRSLGESDTEHYAALRRQLRDVLGDRAFTRLWAARDPRFARIREICLQNGLSREAVMAAYEVVNDGQDALLQTLGTGEADDLGRNRTIQALKDAAHRRLAEVVGPDVAAQIVRNLAVEAARAPLARRRL